MNDDERQAIRDKIIREIRSTEESISSLQELVKPIPPDSAIGRLSRTEAINAQRISEVTLSKSRMKLTLLKRALGRVDSDDFGFCSGCGDPIPVARILLLPDTTTCVDCAS